MNLKIYNAQLALKNDKISPKEVYNALIDIMKQDLNVKTEEEVYEEISKYNAVLFADGTT